MDLKEFTDAVCLFPPFFKDIALLTIILSLIEIAPVKINPWKWLKAFAELPDRINKLEREFKDDKAYRWRNMILSRADTVRRHDKMSKERWDDTIETIDHYLAYCEEQERAHSQTFINGKANAAIAFLKDKYQEALEKNDFLEYGSGGSDNEEN